MSDPINEVFQFKITLKGIRPPVWRRIQVPRGYSFWDLHVAIQDAMGWIDSHLHAFYIQNPRTKTEEEIGIPTEEFGWSGDRVFPGWESMISEYFSMDNPKAVYVYDFGDDWTHEVRLEKILPRESGIEYPLCLKGKRACPPEDCGGIPGYLDLLEGLLNPEHEEHEEILEWIGEDFDPDRFDPLEIRFWDPGDRLQAILSDEYDEGLRAEGEEGDEALDDDAGWLTREYFQDIWQSALRGDLDDLIPEDRRLAEIMLDHREDIIGDFAFTEDLPAEGKEEVDMDPFFHIAVHSIVEDQLDEKDPVEVVNFHRDMIDKGCSHHDAVHLIAAILVPLMFGNAMEQESFGIDTYRALLEKYRKQDPNEILDLLEKDALLYGPDS